MRTVARRGFTLVEMLIVICIIALLMALLVVLIKGVIDRSKNAKSKSLIETLHQGCMAYNTDFGQFPQPYSTSATLHQRLGSTRFMPTGFSSSGVTSTSPKSPYIEFKKDWLPQTATTTAPTPPQPLYDAWERVLHYEAGTNHMPGGADHSNNKSVDIWSEGKDFVDPLDDLTNWVRDY